MLGSGPYNNFIKRPVVVHAVKGFRDRLCISMVHQFTMLPIANMDLSITHLTVILTYRNSTPDVQKRKNASVIRVRLLAVHLVTLHNLYLINVPFLEHQVL